MARFIYGDRIGRESTLRPSVTALIFDDAREKVLLTRRSDNGMWCLPSGGIDPGESAAEACAREVEEETGLVIRVTRLVGVYSSPDRVIEYADGNRFQPLTMSFETEVLSGELRVTPETTEYGYFSVDSLEQLDLMEHNQERIMDALTNSQAAIIQ